jgi:hypothetical protein
MDRGAEHWFPASSASHTPAFHCEGRYTDFPRVWLKDIAKRSSQKNRGFRRLIYGIPCTGYLDWSRGEV